MTEPLWSAYEPQFNRQEFACKCGCNRADMSPAFMDRLRTLRSLYGNPLPVTSGFRCAQYNARVSTTGPNGPHTTGQAADIRISGGEALRLIVLAGRIGFTGVGCSQRGPVASRFLHLDDLSQTSTRPRPWLWTY